MTLGLCMIVKDEAARLSDCLSSVQGWVDEMVIVDTGSQDETIAIAQSFGARVHYFAWCDDFAAARNFSLRWAKSDWILILDADEIIRTEVIPQLNTAMQSPHTLMITLWREEVGAKQSPLSLVSRLFRNHPDLEFKRPYHELIDDSIAQIQSREPHWTIQTLQQPAIRHFGYEATQLQNRAKHERSRRLLQQGIEQYPEDAYLHSKLGGLFCDLKQYDQALAVLENGLKLVEDEPATQYELLYHLGLVHQAQGDAKAAEMAYQQAIAQPYADPLKAGAYLNLGSLYLDHGASEAALKLFRYGVEMLPELAIAHYNLGLAYRTLGKFEAAIAAYEQAIKLDPTYAAAYQNLGVAWLKLGKVRNSQQAFRRAIALYEHSSPGQAAQLRQGLQELGLTLDSRYD